MNIPVPIGPIAIFIALYIFYSANKRRRTKREERQERLAERQEELLEMLRRKNEGKTNTHINGEAEK